MWKMTNEEIDQIVDEEIKALMENYRIGLLGDGKFVVITRSGEALKIFDKREDAVKFIEDKEKETTEQADALLAEKKKKKDACYTKVKSRYKVWPSAYASGALVKCRKVGAKNWGNKSKKKK